MKTSGSFGLRAFIAFAALGYMFTASADIPASAYVQKGLIAQYDGIDNAGTGTHDANATTWKDLKGQGGDMPLDGLTSPVWDGKGLSFSAGGMYNSTDTTKFLCTPNTLNLGDTFTIQMFCNTGDKYDCRRWDVVPYSNSYESWTSQDEGFLERINNANRFSLKPWVSNADIIFTTVVGDKKHRFMIEPIGGTIQSVEGNLSSCTVNNRLAFMKTNGTNVPRKDCYSIRVYNRALTAEEITFNAAIDQVRFDGADPAAVFPAVLPQGCRWNAERCTIERRVSVAAGSGGKISAEGGEAVAEWTAYRATDDQIVLTPQPEDGYVFYCWLGEVDGVTVGADGTATFDGSVPRTLSCQFIANDSLKLIPASEYVQRGLAVHFDGLNNAGVGTMDTVSTIWKDLTGNGHDLALPAGTALGADGGYTFSGATASFTWPGYQALAHSTTELMMSLPPTYAPTKAELNFGVYSAYYGPWTFGFRTTASPGLLVGSELGCYGSYGTMANMYGSTEGVTLEAAATPTTYVKTTQLMSTRISVAGQRLTLKSAGTTSWLTATDVLSVGARNGAVGTLYACRLYTQVLTDDEQAFNRALDSVRFKDVPLAEAAFPAGWRIGTSNNRREVLISLSAANGNGEVSVGEATGVTASCWAVGNEGAVITATPAAGFVFAGWRGDIDGFDATKASVAIPADRPRTLTAHFTVSGGSYAWTGGGDGRMWYDPANWGGMLPGPGATVTIESGTVALDVPPPHLSALTVGGGSSAAKLIVSNWNTKVEADVMTVANKGTIALSGGFDEVSQSNRIWLAGQTLTVAAGGSISANGGGYLGWCGAGWYEQRRRNFSSIPWYHSGMANSMYSGASYGGCQGYPGAVLQATLAGAPYGSAEEPADPGMGGGGTGGGTSISKGDTTLVGGGAIRLDFAGAVSIDGTVSALPTEKSAWQCGGTGGSINIHCLTLSGRGKVLADAQSKDVQKTYAGSSSGGRIAIHYDVTAQEGVDCFVRLSANGGISGWDYKDRLSEPGTIWLPDAQLVKSPLVHCGRFVFPSLTRLDFDSLDVPGRVWWPKGIVLNVAGDLNVVSSNVYVKGMRFDGGELNVGGNVRVAGATLRLGNGCDANIGGNLVQDDSTIPGEKTTALFSRVYFQAGPTNGTDGATLGQVVRIGETFSVASGSTAYFHSQYTNGAISKVVAKNVVLSQGASFNADRGGWGPAKGPGAGNRVEGGKMKSASHGGHGGAFAESLLTQTYGDMKHPLTPGSGAGSEVEGGGAIYVEVSGTMTLNGKVSADATKKPTTWQGAAAGGSVLLDVYKLRGETGLISANGSASDATDKNTGRPGGGGRVAIWTWVNNLSDAVREAVTANAGVAKNPIADEIPAEDGTVYWGAHKGLMLFVK